MEALRNRGFGGPSKVMTEEVAGISRWWFAEGGLSLIMDTLWT